MASKVRDIARVVVLALLAPVVAPLVPGSFGDDEGCACRTRCCRTSQRPVSDAGSCHGRRPDAPSCSMRCDHPASPASAPSLIPFLLEGDPSVVAHVAPADMPRSIRPQPLAGYDRIESPPPRRLLLALS